LKVRRGQAHTLTLDEAAKLLPDDRTALIEYVIAITILISSSSRKLSCRATASL
jgi:hypothetical protein